MEVIYFELNNRMPGCDYPNARPFTDWMGKDLKQQFRNEKWIKENKLVVVESVVDMSFNYCISTTKEWVEENCPELLTKYTDFIRKPDEDDEVYGRFACPFLEYAKE